ncbi:hypothetical protein UlMin_027589 [Ulmus minor]
MFQKLTEKKEQSKTDTEGSKSDEKNSKVTQIQRVPKVMKAEKNKSWEKKYFKPKAIAIGPIHADSKNLSEGKELKLMWAAKYLDGLDPKKIFEDARGKLELLKGHFNEECWDKDAKDVNRTLARMLFVDGCAMLQFIYSFVWDDDFMKHLNINAAQATLVQQDLFLLENQIPFQVLVIIMDGKKEQTEKEQEQKDKERTKMETAIQMFIHMSNMSTAAAASSPKLNLGGEVHPLNLLQQSSSPPKLNLADAVHLLDLLRQSLLHDHCSPPSDDFSHRSALNCRRSFVKYSVFVIFKLPFYVLRFLVRLAAIIVLIFFFLIYVLINFLKNRDCELTKILLAAMVTLLFIACCSKKSESPTTRRSFRNLQELKAAGIELKPSKSRCLKEVSFRPGKFGGCLRLCPILVDKSTAGKLLNLIAYEMCPDYHCKTSKDSKSYDYGISSYLSFLDSLIDNEQDVKDLRAANILKHRLSSDKEVADLFNNINYISVADDAYGKVNSEIQKYYEETIRIWITDFRREHLSSPWTLLALIAAAVALGLTATQTYFAINPR